MKKLILNTLILTVFALFSGCKGKTDNHQNEKPNILWIVADDLGTDLGCFGNSLVHTPNLDRLAGQSVVFDNCFTVTAVCSASRSALITGMYPVSIDCHQHRTRPEVMKTLPENIETVTEYFEDAGYFTFNGKAGSPDKQGKTDYNFKTDYEIFDGTDWSQRAEGQPFFGQIQIHYPHRPFVHDTINPIDESKVKLPPYWADHWITRKDFALYLETVQAVDKQVGDVLKRLAEDGLENNTYIFFVGDQGSPMVRHKQFLYDGGTHTPLIVRFPDKNMAGIRRKELVSNIDLSATSLKLAGIDIPEYMHGQNFLGEHEARNEVYTMRDRRDETVDRIRAVRTDRYKYIRNFYPERPYMQYNAYKRNRYPEIVLMEVLKNREELTDAQLLHMADKRPEAELYDLVNDPFEINNLAGLTEYKNTEQELKEKLDKWIATCDLAKYPEDQNEIDFWIARMVNRDSVWKAKRNLPVDVSNEEYLKWWELNLKKR